MATISSRLPRRLALRAGLAAGLFAGLASPCLAAEPDSDPQAIEIAKKSLAAMGGAENWAQTRFLRFNFFGFRLHHWDRHTGDHRLEGKNREGVDYVVLHNINSRQGKVWLNGQPASAEDTAKWLENAYGAWINDTYWLLMPYKLLDEGVHLKYDGEETLEGKAYHKLKLTFGNVGLTPGDTYWAWINQETLLMDRWAYFLQDFKPEQKPTPWWWLDWQSYGKIKLSPLRRNGDDGKERGLTDLAVLDQLPEGAFTAPAPIAR